MMYLWIDNVLLKFYLRHIPMDALNLINAVVILIGIPTMLGAFIYIGRKLQILDTLSKDVDNIKHNLGVVMNYLIRNHSDFNHRDLKM